MKTGNVIGIVGGVGPYAGLDLNRKIFDQTIASSDQEHLPVILASFSAIIDDRTRYLLKGDVENPAQKLFTVLELLAAAGATVAGIPCNTAHAESIFEKIEKKVRGSGLDIRLLNMISEVIDHIRSVFPKDVRIGVLSTMGTYKTGLYKQYMEEAEIGVLLPDKKQAEDIHLSIYDPGYGIKARSNPVTKEARQIVVNAVRELGERGAAAVVLGCTELPMALPSDSLDGIPLIDPATILARALIRETYPEKLKSLLA
jgi:aspartate racemase